MKAALGTPAADNYSPTGAVYGAAARAMVAWKPAPVEADTETNRGTAGENKAGKSAPKGGAAVRGTPGTGILGNQLGRGGGQLGRGGRRASMPLQRRGSMEPPPQKIIFLLTQD